MVVFLPCRVVYVHMLRCAWIVIHDPVVMLTSQQVGCPQHGAVADHPHSFLTGVMTSKVSSECANADLVSARQRRDSR